MWIIKSNQIKSKQVRCNYEVKSDQIKSKYIKRNLDISDQIKKTNRNQKFPINPELLCSNPIETPLPWTRDERLKLGRTMNPKT